MLPCPPLARLALAALFAFPIAFLACSPSKPADSPDNAPASGDADKPAAKDPDAKADPEAPATPDAAGTGAPKGPEVPKGMSMDSYEMTPSDCNALGRHYGEVARSDQMKDLSPKLSEAQRAATAAQIDKVVSKIEERWTTGCHSALVDKAVDHDLIKCALGAKSVREFDVCLNGEKGTPQPAGKPKKK
jgi:hypothetical protein